MKAAPKGITVLKEGANNSGYYQGHGPLKKFSAADPKTNGRNKNGGDLLSHAVTHAVPSALEGLTSVFGMGTGVAPPLSPPKLLHLSIAPENR